MRNIKAKHATKKEIEFFCSKIPKLEIFDFIGLVKLCGIQLTEPYDPEAVPDDFKPVPRDFNDMLIDLLDYYQNAKKQKRQILMDIVLDCERVNRKNKAKKVNTNGVESENSVPTEIVST
jgi:hypothetical protein